MSGLHYRGIGKTAILPSFRSLNRSAIDMISPNKPPQSFPLSHIFIGVDSHDYSDLLPSYRTANYSYGDESTFNQIYESTFLSVNPLSRGYESFRRSFRPRINSGALQSKFPYKPMFQGYRLNEQARPCKGSL